jgi:hypothetical protein
VRKDLIADSANASISEAKACVQISGETSEEQLSETLRLSNAEESFHCDPPQYQGRLPPCPGEKHDNRTCPSCNGRSFLKKVLGCAERRAACEAAKAAQNAAYHSEHIACIDAWNAGEVARQAAAETARVAARDACLAAKRIVKQFAGDVGEINFQGSFTTSDSKICFTNVKLSSALDNVALTLHVDGDVETEALLHFRPHNITGHLACVFPWSEKKGFRARLIDPTVIENAALQLGVDAGGIRLAAQFSELPVQIRINPNPVTFWAASLPEQIDCPGVDFALPIAIALSPFVHSLREKLAGRFDVTLPSRAASFSLPVPAVKLGAVGLNLVATATPSAIVLRANPTCDSSPVR